MDYTRIYRRQQARKYTDLELVISDPIQIIKISVHKIILILHSPFFDKLLEFNDENSLEINVEDARITFDLILSFYGFPISYVNWSYILVMAKCQDYFDVEVILHKIPEKIESADYNYVLEYCCIIGFDAENLEILVDNLPPDYDIHMLSIDLIVKMIGSCAFYSIIDISQEKILMFNPKTALCVDSIDNLTNICWTGISRNGKYISTTSTTELNIWNTIDNDNICKIPNVSNNITCRSFSPNNIDLALSYKNSSIRIYNMSNTTIIKEINGEISIKSDLIEATHVLYSFNGLYLAAVYDNGLIQIFDTGFYENTFSIKLEETTIDKIVFSRDDEYLVLYTQSDLKILCIKSSKLVELENIIDTSFTSQKIYSRYSNKKYVAIRKNNHVEIRDIADNNRLIDRIEGSFKNEIMFLPFDQYIVIDEMNLIRDVENAQMYLSLGYFNEIVFSLDGKYFATMKYMDVKIWDFYSKSILYSFVHGPVVKMEFSPDNKFFACVCAGNDNIAYVYDMATGTYLSKINGSKFGLFTQKFYNKNLRRLIKNIDEKTLNELSKVYKQ